MNKPKAIEILHEFDQDKMIRLPPDLRAAQKLGIEALELIVKLNADQLFPNTFKLPSETED